MKCEYGCNNEAKYQIKNGKWCCEQSPNSCPVIRKHQGDGLREAYRNGTLDAKSIYANKSQESKDRQAWSRGITVYNGNIPWAKYKKEDIFSINSFATNKTIKNILFNEGIKTCGICNCDNIWNNKPLIFELDHINGNSRDCRRENIRLVCPNCHSQTETFRGRNINKGIVKVSDKEIIDTYKKAENIRQTLLRLGLAAKGGNYLRVQKLISS